MKKKTLCYYCRLPVPHVLKYLHYPRKFKSATMVPINGKPILGWIVDELLQQGFHNFLILIPDNDKHIKEYINNRNLPNDVIFDFCPAEEANKPKGLGHSILRGLRELKKLETNHILIVLGHTIFFDKLIFTEDWVMYSEVEEEMSRWCYVEMDHDKYITRFVDKPSYRSLPDQALVGLYYFQDKELLLRSLEKTIEVENKKIKDAYQLSPALNAYKEQRRIKGVASSTFLDCGSIFGLHRSRRKLIATRSHNSITVDEHVGVLSKKSKKSVDLHQEYSWYISLPRTLKGWAPRVIDYDLLEPDGMANLTLEYYGYHSLEEAWVYQDLQIDIWKSILNHLFIILEKFQKYKAEFSADNFSAIYCDKTILRLKQLKNHDKHIDWHKLLTYGSLSINSRAKPGWPSIRDAVFQRAEALYDKNHITIIHGDFHFANILYDLDSRLVKLIDPRGSFGTSSIFGDCKYDLAKLRHSVWGGYNYIVNDLFKIQHEQNKIDFQIPSSNNQRMIAKWFDEKISNSDFDTESIKLIEGLLFLSMLPLHQDHPTRQLAMFAVAIDRLNEVINPDERVKY